MSDTMSGREPESMGKAGQTIAAGSLKGHVLGGLGTFPGGNSPTHCETLFVTWLSTI